MLTYINLENADTIEVNGEIFYQAKLYVGSELLELPNVFASKSHKLYRVERRGKNGRLLQGSYIHPTLAETGRKRTRKEWVFGSKLPNGHQMHIKVARVLCSTFIHNPNPELKTTVNHINLDSTDNTVFPESNLEWMSLQDNIEHAREKITEAQREARCVPVKLTIGADHFLARSIEDGCKALKELGATGINPNNASNAVNGRVQSSGKLNGVKIHWDRMKDVDMAKELLGDNLFIEI